MSRLVKTFASSAGTIQLLLPPWPCWNADVANIYKLAATSCFLLSAKAPPLSCHEGHRTFWSDWKWHSIKKQQLRDAIEVEGWILEKQQQKNCLYLKELHSSNQKTEQISAFCLSWILEGLVGRKCSCSVEIMSAEPASDVTQLFFYPYLFFMHAIHVHL